MYSLISLAQADFSALVAVGRWQKDRDLSWYAKSDTSPAALSAAEARKEELRKIKEAEQDALSEALGYGPMPKRNANDMPLGKKEVERAIKETAEGDEIDEAKGVGFGAFDGSHSGVKGEERDVLGGVGLEGADGTVSQSRGEGRRRERRRRSMSRDGSRERRRRRSRSRERSRERRHRRREDEDRRRRYKHRSRERSRDRDRRDYARDYDRRSDYHPNYQRRRERSNSPDRHRRSHHLRDRDHYSRG